MWIKYDGWTNLDEQNEWRLCVPKDLQKDVLALVHDDMGHMGYHRFFDHLNCCYYFPKLQHLLKAYIKHCPECLLAQTTCHTRYGSLNPSEVPPTPYHTWVIDNLMGLPSERSKHKYNSVLSLTCKLSQEVALVPGLETWEAEDCGALLYSEVPTKIISDRIQGRKQSARVCYGSPLYDGRPSRTHQPNSGNSNQIPHLVSQSHQ